MIIAIWKNKGVSSLQTYDHLKKITKCGHLGTLDYYAEGVLVILTGKSTIYQDFLHTFPKTYYFTSLIGIQTNSEDICGNIEKKENICDENFNLKKKLEDISKELNNIKILQTCPKISAKKVNGKKMYNLLCPPIRQKEVKIFELNLFYLSDNTFGGVVKCSCGFYIRSLVTLIGEKLNKLCTTLDICRLKVGTFTVNNSNKIEKINKCNKRKKIKRFNN